MTPKALQCPACGSKHLISLLPDAPTFPCDGCGRALKVPGAVRSSTKPLGAATAGGADAAAAAPVPAPAPVPEHRAGVAVAAPSPRSPWYLRLLVWIVAVPAGLVVVVYVARKLDFLSGQRLLDVIVGTGWSRYWRVLVIAPAWALVTTVLVRLLYLLLRAVGARRRAIKADKRGAPDTTPGVAAGTGRANGRGADQRAGRATGRGGP